MKKYYPNSTMFINSFVFSKIKNFRDYFAFGKSVKKSAFVFLLFFVQAVVLAQSIGDYKSIGNVSFISETNWQVWNGSWVNATTAPSSYSFGSASLLTVNASHTLTVSGTVSVSIAKITISGTVNFASNSFLTVASSAKWCAFTINSGGKLYMGSGSEQSTFVLYGNYVNKGDTDFYKSDVIITGDLTSPSTSTLQNNGNVIVGGDIIGDFAITGNSQGPIIYAVNPNATVIITPAVIDSGVKPGDQPTAESVFLQDLVNQVIYEGNSTCTFTLKDPTTNPSTCVGGAVTITIEAILNSTYQWQINSGSTGWSNISGQTSNSLVLTNVVASMKGDRYRVKVTNSGCAKNSNYVTLSIDVATVVGNASSNQAVCSGTPLSNLILSGSTGTIQWQLSTDNVTFGNISGATDSSLTSVQMGVFTGTKYYRAAVTNGGCNTKFSNVISVTVAPKTVFGTINGGTTICSGSTSGLLTLSGHTGTIIKWQSSVSPFSTWTDIINTAATYTSGALSATTQFRAVVQSGSCGAENSEVTTVTVNPSPTITAQPISQLDCEGSIVSFKVVASGTGTLTYTWQRKRPNIDQAFISIPDEKNVTYPNPSQDEIRLENVGTTLSPNGTQYQVLVSNGSCSVKSSPVILSVNEITNVISPPLTPNQSIVDVTLCYGTNYSYTAEVSNPSNGMISYQWKSQAASGSWNNVVDGTHFLGATTSKLNILSGTPAESAKYRVDVLFNRTGGNCSVSSFSKVRLLTFLPLLTTPQISLTNPDCTVITGTVAVTVQSATDTYSFDNDNNYQVSNVKSGLAAGTYNVKIKNIQGCLSSVTTCVITAAPVVSTWSGSSWSPSAPTSIDKIIFDAPYNSTGILEACSCQVNAGVNVLFKSVDANSGHTLKITNQVKVLDTGTLTFENNASLVQVNDVNTNIGNIIYKRTTPSLIETDYTYWSSPVADQSLNISSDYASGTFYSFDSTTNDWASESLATKMNIGRGYIIRGQKPDNTAYTITAAFKGVPNNGAISITGIQANQLYLLGNPYPSLLDANQFLTDNSSVLDGTLYFWTHRKPINIRADVTNPGSGAYAYSSDDYATYNLTGGVGTDTPTYVAGGNGSVSGSEKPSGNIASGQGFFTSSKEIPTVTSIKFSNSMRIDKDNKTDKNSQFFKTATNLKIADAIEKNRVWLNLTNAEGAFKQTLVGYITGATNGYEGLFDGESYDGNQFIDFYSVNQDKNLVIQGRALPFEDTDEVPLGYSSTIDGKFEITIDELDGLLVDKDIFLEDRATSTTHNLKEGAYKFNTQSGVFNDRFVLKYTNKTLALDDVEVAVKGVAVSKTNKQLRINSLEDEIYKVQVYDLLGRLIYHKNNLNTTEFVISNIASNSQALLVKVGLRSGKTTTRKILY